MKRSKLVGLALMGSAPVLLTACSEPAPPEVPAYGSVDECVQGGIFTRQACESGQAAAMQAHLNQAPRFANQSTCEQEYGANNCQQVQAPGGGSWFMPAMAGFIVGNMLADRDRDRGYYYGGGYYGGYRGKPLYRDRYGSGQWRTSDGMTIDKGGYGKQKAITSSRGGFGSQAAARGSWGG